MGVRVSAIGIHPVKSTQIRHVRRAEVTPAGLRGDREWMVVDVSGEMISARQEPRLFTIRASNAVTGGTDADLRLDAPGRPPLELSTPTSGEVDVRLFRSTHLRARPAGDEADGWLAQHLGRDDIRLVWCPTPQRRGAGQGDLATFQDGSPVTLLSMESVAQVDTWAAEAARERGETPTPLVADRFRPSILVDGAPAPFAEDDWPRVRIGDVVLRTDSPVARCAMTTIDPGDLARGKEPLRTLAIHRRWDGATWLAVNLVPERVGTIEVGDEVVIG